jgi:hypothetical protein
VVSVDTVRVACPSCGAASELTPGDSVDTCRYCRAPLIPGTTAMKRGVDAAALARHRAQLEKYRHERAGHAAIQRYNMSNYLPFIVVGSFAPMLGLSAIAFTWSVVSGEEPFHPGLVILWMAVIALLAGLKGFASYRRNRRAAFRNALADLTRQFGGSVFDQLKDNVAWLNRHWAGPYDVADLVASPYAVSAAISVRGCPVLIDLDATAPAQHQHPRLNLLLAAVLTNDAGNDGQRRNAAKRRLHAGGFTVTVNEAGLLATARKELLASIRKTPGLLHEVAPAVVALADYADAMGAFSTETTRL